MSIVISTTDIQPHLLDGIVLSTLTNYGYLLYTLNMLKSLRPYGLDKKVLIITIDEKSHTVLQNMGYHTICIHDSLAKFFPWNSKGYDKICYYKLEMIYQILSLGYNLVLIDGDIVFQQNPIKDILEWNKSTEDVWIQNDSTDDNNTTNMCTGYMFIRSNKKMIDLYDCISDAGKEKYKKCALNNNDQTYFNIYVKPECTMKALPLTLYPNGEFFYKSSTQLTETVLVHFNWVKGHEKMAKMKAHKMWLLTSEEEMF
jgi:hypothetical protein